MTLHGLQKLSTFSASYYHRVNTDVEVGAKVRLFVISQSRQVSMKLLDVAQAIYNSKAPTSNVALEVGCKSYLDSASFVKAKINNAGILLLGYTQALRPGVKMSAGVALDTQKIGSSGLGEKPATGSGHSVGLSLTLFVPIARAFLSLC